MEVCTKPSLEDANYDNVSGGGGGGGGRFSKDPETFRARKAIAKILNLNYGPRAVLFTYS